MGNNKQVKKNIGGPPPVDESWWMAVLEDVEDRHSGKSTKKQPVENRTREVDSSGADQQATIDWDWALEIYEQDQVVELEVTGHNRGGILVIGDRLQGFVPISHLVDVSRECSDESGEKNSLDTYMGKTLPLKVIECDKERGRVVFSERAAQTDPGRRIELLDDLQEGDCIHGQVTTLTNFGAFVDLGGIEGLIHISELSWGRVQNPDEIVSEGQQVEVCVIQIDRSRSRVALSLKRLLPNPWDTIETSYHQGQILEAVITSVVSFGAFARLESGLDGLIHASELGPNGNEANRPDEILQEGQNVQVRILNIDPERQRLGLSLEAINE